MCVFCVPLFYGFCEFRFIACVFVCRNGYSRPFLRSQVDLNCLCVFFALVCFMGFVNFYLFHVCLCVEMAILDPFYSSDWTSTVFVCFLH